MALLAIALWAQPSVVVGPDSPWRRAGLGLVLGIGATAGDFASTPAPLGAAADVAAPLVAVAGLVGGPLAAAVAVMSAVIARLYCGSAGQPAALASLVVAAVIGIAAHVWMRAAIATHRPVFESEPPAFCLRRRTVSHRSAEAAAARRGPGLWTLSLFGAIVSASHAATLVLATLVAAAPVPPGSPGPPGTTAQLDGAAILVFDFVATIVLALALFREDYYRSLSATEGIFRAIVESLPDSLNAKDRDSRFIAANAATARLMRAQSVADLIGKSDADFYPAAMAEAFRQEECAVLHNAKVGPVDQEIEFADGSRRRITTLKIPLVDQDGSIFGIITHNRDVTERKKLETELEETRHYLRQALENMADGLVLYTADGTIKFCNRKYRELFPTTADLRVEGSNLSDILREAVRRGEEESKADIEAWIAERLRSLQRSADRLIHLRDGRIVEARTRLVNGSNALVVFTDVTAQKQIERDLQRRAAQDPLTGLLNRAEFNLRFEEIHRQVIARGRGLAVMMLDLDRFKPINDHWGHAVGDRLLIEVAMRLRSAFRSDDLVARLGGDEFAFVILADSIETVASALADRVLEMLTQPFHSDGIELVPGASLGIAYFTGDGSSPQALLEAADKALYEVKKRGGGHWLARHAGEPAVARLSAGSGG